MAKYIFVTGGVCSSLGKGLTAASIGFLLEELGYKIGFLKMDPYINFDPGTMSPYQHGEVYVTKSGHETDLDLGHYERFTHAELTGYSSITSGKIYRHLIDQERRGEFLGETVQVIPHITNEIKRRIYLAAEHADVDFLLVEIGGTVGDIESQPFLEAVRQMEYSLKGEIMNLHLTYIPYLKAAKELKTKPTQHSVQALRGLGLFPHILICRSENELPLNLREKLSMLCHVDKEAVISLPDTEFSIYEIPWILDKAGLTHRIIDHFSLKKSENPPSHSIGEWLEKKRLAKIVLCIGIVGKYLEHKDAYISIYEALEHAAVEEGVSLKIIPIEAEKNVVDLIENFSLDALLVPGGFGSRGWEEKISALKYAREKQIPCLGICLGMQAMVVEFARHVLGISQSNSAEIESDMEEPVVMLMQEQKVTIEKGGTMRLGTYLCSLNRETNVYNYYGKIDSVEERHRHRYEVNSKYKEQLKRAGLLIAGEWKEGGLIEIVEVKDHPFMVGVQFHPEYRSKIFQPHPLFLGFIKEAVLWHKKKSS